MKWHRHIGCYGLILKGKRIVLIRKSRGPYTGKLDLPGGGIEDNEIPEDCLIREIKEETNLDVVDFQIFDAFSWNVTWKELNKIENLKHIGIVYKVNVTGTPSGKGDGIDSLGAYYFEIEDLKKEELTPFAFLSLTKLGYNIK